jgi:site-specific DNA recombinase
MRTKSSERFVAGYLRVSTEMQVERESLQNQEQALTAYCQTNDHSLHLYRDEGVSAKDIEQPQLQRLLRDVRAGRVTMVLVTKLDRISRSLHDLLDLMALFEKQNVQFISLRDNIDTSGPVGRFILHILGAIAELERGITAERVAEDMKLRAKRGKWNGGMTPYGRTLVEGKLVTVSQEAAILRHIRDLLKEKRSWRGVVRALNREGKWTREWEPVEVNGRVVRKGKPPAEWTAVTVKRVLLQPINEGTLVYNRRQAKGRTHAARPEEEHVVVEGYCEPVFSHEEMAELRNLAAEIEGEAPRSKGSQHLLSGLVECGCGARMYASKSYVRRKEGQVPVVHYRCRREGQLGTCQIRQVPARVVEPLVVEQLRKLSLDPQKLQDLAGQAEDHFQSEVQPLLDRRAHLVHERERLERKGGRLLELAEDGLITKGEFASRRSQLAEEGNELVREIAHIDADLRVREESAIDITQTLGSLRHLRDVYDELDEVADRRQLLRTCLNRLVVQESALELHVPAVSLLLLPNNKSGKTQPGASSDTGLWQDSDRHYGVCERMDALWLQTPH